MKAPFENLKKWSRRLPAPTFRWLFGAFFLLASFLFLRPPDTNFVYDEQEALLANPYLAGDVSFFKLLEVDFWGRSPERTIGSYRPLPNLLWRGLAFSLEWNTPWLLTWLNLAVHALNATLLGRLSAKLYPQAPSQAWLLGGLFVVCALSTEAVCGVVGLADLLVLFFALCVCHVQLLLRRSSLLFLTLLLLLFAGCLSKETQLTLVPGLVLVSPFFLILQHGMKVRGRDLWLRAALVLVAGLLAQWGAVLLRKTFFPIAEKGKADLIEGGVLVRLTAGVERYWNSPPWPHDVFNNPLLEASQSERWATASAMYLDQLRQFLLAWDLTGDYSYPHQPVHDWQALAVFGASVFVVSNVLAAACVLGSLKRRRISAISCWAVGWLWFSLVYFPLSGALFSLPTIRAERLIYPGLAGLVLALVSLLGWAEFNRRSSQARRCLRWSLLVFVLEQSFFARRHALHFSDDVSFWRAACAQSQPSAKSFLNLGVMLGARGDLDGRLEFTGRAVKLAPRWPMAQIYLADTFCRRDEMSQAREPYLLGLALAPESKAMTALSLQCIWDKGYFPRWRNELNQLAQENTGSWLDFFVFELAERGEKNGGIPKKYRPRHYNRRQGGH